MRIALETECDEKKYLALLKKRALLCCKTLDTVRHIIHRNIEKGLLPNYQEGAVEMDKQYCTMGILGLYEVIEAFGYTKTDEFGYISYTDEGVAFASKIFEVLNEVKDNFTDEYSFNIESVPAERAAVILCQKDNVLYDHNDKFIYSISGFLCRPNAPFRKNCGCALFWMRSVPAVVSPTSIWSRISPIRIWHGRCSTRLHSQALSTLHLTPASTNASIITVS